MEVQRREVLERLRDHLTESDIVVAALACTMVDTYRVTHRPGGRPARPAHEEHRVCAILPCASQRPGGVESMNAMQAPVAVLFPPNVFF